MNTQMMSLLLPIAALLGWGGAFLVARHGQRVGLLDHPNARSSHLRPTPKGGGIGILAAVGMAGIMLEVPWYAWVPAVMVATFSIGADLRDIAPSTRLKMHFLAAFVFLIAHAVSTPDNWNVLLLIVPWAIFVAGTENIYNFMDGINGIAGLSGVVGFSLLALFLARFRASGDAVLLYCLLAAACAGFLPLNFPRARVFMGDVGSILLGFLFACGVVMAGHSVQDFMCAASFLFPFYADEITTMFVRLRNGENLTTAHRRHVYQLLVNEMEYPHWKVAVGYGMTQAAVGAGSLLLVSRGWLALSCFLFACSITFVIVQACIRMAASAKQVTSQQYGSRVSA